ncbi:MAG: hypothetical protein HY301_15205 [Verrucomicrobia bacterium]|nr:hypothetical protein [Verrucomicrobiota bacterium]
MKNLMTNGCRSLKALGLAAAVAGMAVCASTSAWATACDGVPQGPQILQLTVTPSKSVVVTGETITYTYTLKNIDPLLTVNFLSISDNSGTIGDTSDDFYVPIGSIAPGETQVYQRSYVVKLTTGCQTNNAGVLAMHPVSGVTMCTPAISVICIAKVPCPLSQGYWKTHCDLWPVTNLTMGCQTYTKAELIYILKTPSYGDASLILADQLIAALLNIANGAAHDAKMDAAIANANNLLCQAGRKVPACIRTCTTLGNQMACAALVLDAYNNGLFTPGCSTCSVEHDDDCDKDCGGWHYTYKKTDLGHDRDRHCRK